MNTQPEVIARQSWRRHKTNYAVRLYRKIGEWRYLPGHWWYQFKHTLRWLPVIWQDQDTDYAFLLRAMEFKLKLMEEHFRSEHCHIADAEKVARQLMICKVLAHRLGEDDYCLSQRYFNPHLHDKHWAKWVDQRSQQDVETFCRVWQRHLRCWWD